MVFLSETDDGGPDNNTDLAFQTNQHGVFEGFHFVKRVVFIFFPVFSVYIFPSVHSCLLEVMFTLTSDENMFSPLKLLNCRCTAKQVISHKHFSCLVTFLPQASLMHTF